MQGQFRDFYIASNPSDGGANPYIGSFYNALKKYGINLAGELLINDDWLIGNAKKLNAIHIHWPETIWRSRNKNVSLRIKNIVGLWRYLRLAEKNKIIRVWTAHNIEHHEGSGFIDRLGYFVLSKCSDIVIVHNEYASNEIMKKYNTTQVPIIMPHGNYDGSYPTPRRDRSEMLKALGLSPQKKTLLCAGNIREYKGVDLACLAMQYLSDDYQLVIAGMPIDNYVKNKIIEASFLSRNNIIFKFNQVSAQDFADLFNAADVILLPYRKITGSGVLMAALTLNRGVIASDLPPFREILSINENAGVLFEPNNPKVLASAVKSYFELSSKVRNEAARSIADMFPWSSVVEEVAMKIREKVMAKGNS